MDFIYPILANATTTPISSSDFQSVMEALTGQLSVSTVVGVLATCIGASVGFVFMWWGVRKLTAMLQRGFKGRGMNP